MPSTESSNSANPTNVEELLAAIRATSEQVASDSNLTTIQERKLYRCFNILEDSDEPSTRQDPRRKKCIRFLNGLNTKIGFASVILCAMTLEYAGIGTLSEETLNVLMAKLAESWESLLSTGLKELAKKEVAWCWKLTELWQHENQIEKRSNLGNGTKSLQDMFTWLAQLIVSSVDSLDVTPEALDFIATKMNETGEQPLLLIIHSPTTKVRILFPPSIGKALNEWTRETGLERTELPGVTRQFELTYK